MACGPRAEKKLMADESYETDSVLEEHYKHIMDEGDFLYSKLIKDVDPVLCEVDCLLAASDGKHSTIDDDEQCSLKRYFARKWRNLKFAWHKKIFKKRKEDKKKKKKKEYH